MFIKKEKRAAETSYFAGFRNDELFFLPKYRRKEHLNCISRSWA